MKKLLPLIVAVALATVALAQAGTGTLAGRVVDERGKGVSGAHVHVEGGGGSSDATANGKGEFEIALAPGEYRVTVTADGYSEVELPEAWTVVAGKKTRIKEKVSLRETAQGSVIRGSVFSDEGRSLAGVKVVLEREGGDGRPFKMESRTDGTGIFAFDVPKGVGRYRLTASREGFTPSSKTVEVGGGEITNIAIKLSASSPRSGNERD